MNLFRKKFDEASFLQALESTVPEQVLRREESAKETRAALAKAHGDLAVERQEERTGARRLVTVPRVLVASGTVVALGILVLALFFAFGRVKTHARLEVHRGEAIIYRAGSEASIVCRGEVDLRDDDNVTASENALVSIYSHETDSTRMDGSTELSLEVLDRAGVAYVQESGRAYFHDKPGYKCSVALGEVTINKVGGGDCIYSTDFHQELARMRVIKGDVAVTVGEAEIQHLSAGEELLAGIVGGERHVEVNGYEPQVLEEEWHQWNFERDEQDELESEQDANPGDEPEPEQEQEPGTEPEHTPAPEPEPAPAPEPVSGGLGLQYMCGETNPSDNQVQPRFKVVNNTGSSVPLSEFTIKYWYTIDGEKPQNFWCDWAQVGSGNVQGAFHKLGSARSGADYYLEVSFAPGAGVIATGCDSGEVQCRFAKSDWTNYNESGDYSHSLAQTSYAEWSKVTLYRNGILVWGTEPDPAPAPPPAPENGGLGLQYMCGETNPSDNQVQPRFKVVNNTGSSVPLSEFTIKYWYTIDGEKPQNFWCDWAQVGSGNVQGAFHKLGSARSGADYYLEVSFAPGAGVIATGCDSGEVQCRFAKSDWTNYNESGDYSHGLTQTSYAELNKVTLYRNGILVWGTEPGGN